MISLLLRAALLTVVVCFGQPLAQAQTWTQRLPSQQPSGRFGHSLAFDAARGQTILFGGAGGSFPVTYFGETWAWDGSTWSQRTPPASPAPRSGAAMAYDAGRRQVVLFGGSSSGTIYNDTWAWDGSNWARLPTTTPPSGMLGDDVRMVYDAARSELVLYSGRAQRTWTWDGTNWIVKTTATAPPPRAGFGMAYDPLRAETVLFGGVDSRDGTTRGDTWVWSGTAWTLRTPASTPQARWNVNLVFDASSGTTLLFGGGSTASNAFLNQNWLWDGSNWRQQFPPASPPARNLIGIAYDSIRKEVVLFGGWGEPLGSYLNDTWVWQATAACSYAVSVTSISAPAAGAYGSVSVTATPPPCSWSAAARDGFITITSAGTGSGNGAVSYAISPNTGAARSGTLVIAGLSVSILQQAGPPGPLLNPSGIVSGASFEPGVASGSWITLTGSNLAPKSRSWADEDFVGGRLPTALDGVSVTVGGKPAYLAYISPDQINALVAADPKAGLVDVQVTTSNGTSQAVAVQKNGRAPALFLFPGTARYPAAVFADGVYVGPPELFGGAVPSRAARPGDTILLFATGLGPTLASYDDGTLVASAMPLADPVAVRISGVSAEVAFAGLVAPGLYQINVKIPEVPAGDVSLDLEVASVHSQANVRLRVDR